MANFRDETFISLEIKETFFLNIINIITRLTTNTKCRMYKCYGICKYEINYFRSDSPFEIILEDGFFQNFFRCEIAKFIVRKNLQDFTFVRIPATKNLAKSKY